MSDWTIVAETVKAKVAQGGLVARSVAGLPFLLACGMEVAFVPPVLDAPRRGTVASVTDAGKGAHLVTFDSVPDADTAAALVGCKLLVRRADLPELALDERGDTVVGYTVRSASDGVIGTVSGIIDNPGQSLLAVARADGGEALIPIVEEFVLDVDDAARTIAVDVPSGLLEL